MIAAVIIYILDYRIEEIHKKEQSEIYPNSKGDLGLI
jgi:hypothetical protein